MRETQRADPSRGSLASTGRITFVGHATVLLELGGVRLLTDPVLRGRVAHLRRHGPRPEPPDRLDAVLVSHMHYDHLDLASLRMVGSGRAEAPRLIVPRGAGAFLRRKGFDGVDELAAGEIARVGDVEILAAPAEHDDRRRPLGPRADAIGFVITGARRVYFAGDTALFPGMSDLAPLELALLPVAGWAPKMGPGHMDPHSAARAAARLRPRVAVPIHWGTFHPRWTRRGAWFSEPPHVFAAELAERAPEVEVRLLAPGESLEL
jgi:L-ascorbate metabolism protein UlaG (beta-lactamase superfamily)